MNNTQLEFIPAGLQQVSTCAFTAVERETDSSHIRMSG